MIITIIQPTITLILYVLTGAEMFARIIKPTIASKKVAATETSSLSTPKVLLNTTSAAMAKKSVNAAGIAFKSTFTRKCPFILLLFGSMARKNPGIPIFTRLTIVICEGYNGYVNTLMIEKSARRRENMFFTRKRVAVLSMLLIFLLPSETILGILEKSESRRTTCAA